MDEIPNVEALLDEIRGAELVARDEYSTGYYDGLAMALSILEGRVE
jgi:hypothetical protein